MSLLKKILLGLAGLAVLALAGVLGFVYWIGAWHLVFPTEAYETEAPPLEMAFGEDAALRVLVYTKTNAFRHKEGIPGARALIDELASEHDWAVFHTENSAALERDFLDRFEVVVFAHASGNHASDAQDAAFAAWLEAGGGWVGLHAAGDGSHASFPWYAENLISGAYLGHILGPQSQEARVVVEARTHPVARGLPASFLHTEEWYSWDRGAREAGFQVIATVDESTYEPFIRGAGQEKDIRMGDHPIVWTRCLGRGRAVYSAMGHFAAAYEQDYTRKLLANAIDWAGGLTPDECTATGVATR